MQNQLSCIIIDDDIYSGQRLKDLLMMIPDVRIDAVGCYTDQIIDEINVIKPDIIFLEVEGHQKNGFEICEELKRRKIKSRIIFTASQTRYSIKAIRHEAFDFLLKPIDIDELKMSIRRFVKRSVFGRQDIELRIMENLSLREKEVAGMLMQGKSSSEIAKTLLISKNTVDTHRRKIIEKTGINSTLDLITKRNLERR